MAEPLQFTMHLKRKDHLWYFARHYFPDLWTPWLVGFGVSFVFAAAYKLNGMPWLEAGLRFAIGGLVVVLFMFLLAVLLYALRLRKFGDDGAVLSPKEVTVDAEGVHIRHTGGSGSHLWSHTESIKERGRFLFLKLREDEILLLFPRRDLPEGGVDTMRTLWEQAR